MGRKVRPGDDVGALKRRNDQARVAWNKGLNQLIRKSRPRRWTVMQRKASTPSSRKFLSCVRTADTQ
jgi:hypothetical protein